MPKAISYIRFSSAEQMSGDSYNRQTAHADEWARANGYDIVTRIEDLGVSGYRGYNFASGKMSLFLDLVRKGKIEPGTVLIVESLDRLSRDNVLYLVPTFVDIIKAGIDIVTLIDGQRYSRDDIMKNQTPLLMSMLIMIRAHEESATKSKRVQAACFNKLARLLGGEKLILAKRLPAWLEVVKGKGGETVQPIPERAAIIDRIFTYTAAGWGRRMIVKKLNSERIPAFQSENGWQESYIAKLLNNFAVIGEFHTKKTQNCETIIVEDYFPAVISKELFYRARAARDSRKSAAGRLSHSKHFILRGMVECDCCGSKMRRVAKGSRSRAYLICSSAARSAGCDNVKKWPVDGVENAVARALTPREIEAFLPNSDSDDGKILALEAEIRSLHERSQRLLDLVEDGDANALERYKTNAQRIAALKTALTDEKSRIAEMSSQGDATVYVKDLNDLFSQLAAATDENELRIQISQKLRSLFKRVIFDKDTVHIEFEQTASKLKYEDGKIIGRELVSSISRRKVLAYPVDSHTH